MPVSPARRKAAESTCSSARESLSVQSLSPVVTGRLATAETQSSVPAGLKETCPFVTLRRATRPGGSSSSSAAARLGAAKANAKINENSANKYSERVFMVLSSLLERLPKLNSPKVRFLE